MSVPIVESAAARPGGAADAVVDGMSVRGMAAVSALDVLHEIADVVGPARALGAWSTAAVETGAHGMALDFDQLQAVGRWLVANSSDQALRMAARSALARLRVQQVLAKAEGWA